jgi:small ligand-binding sensory domain FIST
MRIAATAANRGPNLELTKKLIAEILQQLDGGKPHLGVLLVTSHFDEDLGAIAEQIRTATNVDTLLGCTAEGVIGPGHEYEQEPAISLWMASMPGVTIRPFHVAQAELEAASSSEDWRAHFMMGAETMPYLLVLADPYSVDPATLLDGINEHLAGCRVFGGMASGAEGPDQSVVLLDDIPHRIGAVGVALSGPLTIDTVVSQGCRPVGRPFIITRAERNVIYQLGGKKPLAVLQEMFHEAPAEEQRLMNQGLFLGRAINEQKPEFTRGDFLIRNLMGVDEESGAIAVGDHVRVGITVQFHVRDAATADEDLRALLAPHASQSPAGVLLFSCNGRGRRMFPERHHDAGVVQELLGRVPVAGFFCSGELGPVGGKNFIHGHTASLALFRAKELIGGV